MSGAELFALLPVLVLAAGSVVLLMAGTWPLARRLLLGAGILVALAAVAATLFTPSVTEAGGMFGTGPYARLLTAFWSLAAALTLGFSLRYAEEQEFAGGEYAALVLFAAAGMSLLSSATSLVGLFLGLEAYTLVLYILIAFSRRGIEGAEAGLKYLVLGAVATGFLAFGIALIYASSGTFHLPEAVAGMSSLGVLRPMAMAGWSLLLIALGFKVSLVPFHLWTPDVYQGAPAPVTGLLATGSKGAVFAAMVLLLLPGVPELAPVLWVLSALTMLVGTFCALRQENVKRLLAYSSIVHMGYLLMALLAGGDHGRTAVLFYLAVYGAAALGSFGIIATLSTADGEPQLLEEYRGLGTSHPFRAGALALFLFSLAGIPPAAGFIGKFGLFHAAVDAGYLRLALLGILASLVSVYYYLRVVVAMFMSGDKPPAGAPRGMAVEHVCLAACIGLTLLLGLYPGPLLDLIVAAIP